MLASYQRRANTTTNQPHQKPKANKRQPPPRQWTNAGHTPKASKCPPPPPSPAPPCRPPSPPTPHNWGQNNNNNKKKSGGSDQIKHKGRPDTRQCQAREAGRKSQRTQTAKEEESQEEEEKEKGIEKEEEEEKKEEEEEDLKRKTQHKPWAEAAEGNWTRESRSPRASKDKRHKTNANATTRGKKTNTPGGQKPPSANRQPPKERKTAQHPGHQKTNTNSSDQHQRTIANHSTKRKRNTTQGAGPPKQQNKRRPRRSRSPKTLKDRFQPQAATNTNRCEQKAWKRKTQRPPQRPKQRAESQEQLNARQQLTRHCYSCTGVGERMGVLVGNKPLVPPPGSAPSHEISPSPMAQDPGEFFILLFKKLKDIYIYIISTSY